MTYASNKPASYPFLAISKDYNLPYAVVLKAADDLRRGRMADARPILECAGMSFEVLMEIAGATEEQRMVRDGEIDWQTGEPTAPLTGSYTGR
jgi:hypothetical protein